MSIPVERWKLFADMPDAYNADVFERYVWVIRKTGPQGGTVDGPAFLDETIARYEASKQLGNGAMVSLIKLRLFQGEKDEG